MNATQAAGVLRVSPQRVRQLCRTGKLRATVGKTREGCDTWVIDDGSVNRMAAARGVLPEGMQDAAVEGGAVAPAPVVSVGSVAEEPVGVVAPGDPIDVPPDTPNPIEERWKAACAQHAPTAAQEAASQSVSIESPSLPPEVFVNFARELLGARFKAYELLVVIWAGSMSRTVKLEDLVKYDAVICWGVPGVIAASEGTRQVVKVRAARAAAKGGEGSAS